MHMMGHDKPTRDDPVEAAAYTKLWAIVSVALDADPRIDVRRGGPGGKTPLMVAAAQNNTTAMTYLLYAGASGFRRVPGLVLFRFYIV